MKAFLAELRKRKVVHVAVAYLAVGWVIMEVADLMFPALSLPDWSVSLVVAMVVLGFPVALLLSWAYELGPDGLRRERNSPPAGDGAPEGDAGERELPDVSEKSVAVLPFVDMSPERNQEYFSDGLTEELMNALAQVEALRLCSRTSCFALKGASAGIPEIAEMLRVAYVVEGSVRKAGNRLRITAQLIRAATDTHVWSHAYDRDLDDVFAIQNDIARQIAGALEVRLLPRDLPVPSTESVEAYEYYLRGRSLLYRLGQQNIRKAAEMFEKATQIDRNFARGWAGCGIAHAYLAVLYRGGDSHVEAAVDASERAIALGPEIAETHIARMMALAAVSRFAKAEVAFQQAVELNPREFEAYYQFGRVQFKQGNLERAVELFERARNVNPDDFQSPLLSVSIYRRMGEKEKAREAARHGVQAAEKHIEQHPDNPRAYVLAAGGLEYLGEREKALQYVDQAVRLDPGSEDTQYNAACFYAVLGELDKAIDCLERGVHDPDWFETDPDLDPLRDHPRFKALMKGIRR